MKGLHVQSALCHELTPSANKRSSEFASSTLLFAGLCLRNYSKQGIFLVYAIFKKSKMQN
jgi:hypothetical protein